MNIIKERRKSGAICSKCKSPDYTMTPPIKGETTKPMFTCRQCGHIWFYGRDGGKYAEFTNIEWKRISREISEYTCPVCRTRFVNAIIGRNVTRFKCNCGQELIVE